MDRKRKSAEDDFTEHLTQALDNFSNPTWLGTYSPLATPYFLGNYLRDLPTEEAERASGRGKALQRLLLEAAEVLAKQDEEGAYAYRLLKLTFFQTTKVLLDILHELNIARATFYRDRKSAIQGLEAVLVQRLHPTLRLESPLQPQVIFGREEVLQACLLSLQQGQTIAIVGAGGSGKTVLAAHLATRAEPRPVFWYTFHIGWNDHLHSLLFALAYFLQQQGAPDLWLQLVADEGQVDMNVAPALLRHGLETLGAAPLLCFDEVDLLRPEVEAHGQLLNFLESLPAELPVIFIGQRIHITAQHFYELGGLSLAAIHELLEQAGIVLSMEQLTRLQSYTQGNPRFLILFLALHQGGEPLADVLAGMASAPSLEALLNRIWRRLVEAEHRLLMELAVYRRPVPAALWPEIQDQLALRRLMEWRLVQSDGQDAIMLLPLFRQTIYQNLSPEHREQLHLEAAAVRASQREYTATAYHYVQAGRPELAVRLWYTHRTAEINQGQSEAALALFGELSQNQLHGQDQECLGLIRSELWHLQGDYAWARESLQATPWQTPMLKARAKRLEGDVAEIGGELETAAHAYQEGLMTLQALSENEVALFHRDLGWVYRRQHNFDQAWREAQLARYEIENLQGHIQRDRGRLAEAKLHYMKALELAQELGHLQGLAKTHNVLANALVYQGEFDAAVRHWDDAYKYFKQIGKLSSLASVRANQATGRVLAGQPQQAIPLAGEALAWFERFGQPFGIAVAAQILAEAHLALGELETAERFAWQALETEEISTVPEALRTLGEISLARQDTHTAEQYVRRAIAEAQQNQRSFVEAYAWRALGTIHIAQGKLGEAQTALEQAIMLFQEIGLSVEMEKTQVVLKQIKSQG